MWSLCGYPGSDMKCPDCGVEDVIEIQQRLPDGTEVYFCACHRCEHKWWDRNGESITLSQVLDIARQSR